MPIWPRLLQEPKDDQINISMKKHVNIYSQCGDQIQKHQLNHRTLVQANALSSALAFHAYWTVDLGHQTQTEQ